MRILAFLLSALTLAGQAHAQSTSTLTLRQARAMDHSTLARHVLGLAGERMAEHRIAVGEGSFRGPRGGIHSISFASAPKREFGGLCRAERVHAQFHPQERTAREDPPVTLSELRVDLLWAILPEQSGDRADCAPLGRVLETSDRPGPYFRARGPRRSELYPVTIRRAVALYRGFVSSRGEGAGFRCQIAPIEHRDPREAACADRGAALALLDLSRLDLLEVAPCRTAEALCVSFRFGDPSPSIWEDSALVLTLRTDAAPHADLDDTHRVTDAHLGKEVQIV